MSDRARDEATLLDALQMLDTSFQSGADLHARALAAFDRLSADRDTPPEKDSDKATSKDSGDGGGPADVGTAAKLSRLNEQPTLSPRPWELIFDRGPCKHFDGTPAPGTAPLVNTFRIVDADNRLLVRIQADPEQALKVEDMQLIVEAVNALAAEVSGGTPLSERGGDDRARIRPVSVSETSSGSLSGGTTETAKPSSPNPTAAKADAARATLTRIITDGSLRAGLVAHEASTVLTCWDAAVARTEVLEQQLTYERAEVERLTRNFAKTRESVGRLEEALRAAERERDEKVSRRIAVDALVDAYDREQKLTEERNEARLRAAVAQQERNEAVKRAYITDVVSRAEEDRQKWRVGRLEEALRAIEAWLRGCGEFADTNPGRTLTFSAAALLGFADLAAAALVGVEPPHGKDLGAARGGVAEPGQPSGGSAIRIAWADVQAGDLIELEIFTLREGRVRERRSVLEVAWPWVVLTGDPADPERIYRIDATALDRIDRRLSLIHRPEPRAGQDEARQAPMTAKCEAEGCQAAVSCDDHCVKAEAEGSTREPQP